MTLRSLFRGWGPVHHSCVPAQVPLLCTTGRVCTAWANIQTTNANVHVQEWVQDLLKAASTREGQQLEGKDQIVYRLQLKIRGDDLLHSGPWVSRSASALVLILNHSHRAGLNQVQNQSI